MGRNLTQPRATRLNQIPAAAFWSKNNIFQQVTTPLNLNGGTAGAVVGYNFAVKDIFADGSWTWGVYASHSAGNNFNLFEGNDAYAMFADNASARRIR